jgi:hypothetical protein
VIRTRHVSGNFIFVNIVIGCPHTRKSEFPTPLIVLILSGIPILAPGRLLPDLCDHMFPLHFIQFILHTQYSAPIPIEHGTWNVDYEKKNRMNSRRNRQEDLGTKPKISSRFLSWSISKSEKIPMDILDDDFFYEYSSAWKPDFGYGIFLANFPSM